MFLFYSGYEGPSCSIQFQGSLLYFFTHNLFVGLEARPQGGKGGREEGRYFVKHVAAINGKSQHLLKHVDWKF